MSEEAKQAYDQLGDGVMWLDERGFLEEYFMRRGDTQDIVPVPRDIAFEIMPKLTRYTRFGQQRWYRSDAQWRKLGNHLFANFEQLNP
jgi:hypothetical protein